MDPRLYPLNNKSKYYPEAKRFSAYVLLFYIINALILFFGVPSYPQSLNRLQYLFSFGYYTGILSFLVFLFFIPQKLSRAKFLHTLSIYFLFGLPIFVISEYVLNTVKMGLSLEASVENFSQKLITSIITFLMHLAFFALALGIRKLINYVYDLYHK